MARSNASRWTEDLRIAKLKRDDRLAALRSAAAANPELSAIRTIGDAVSVVAGRLLNQPQLEAPTIKYYREMIAILNETLPITVHGRTWTAGEAASWWSRVASKYSAQRANNILGTAKKAGRVLVELGLRSDDPTSGLKRLKIEDKVLMMPSREQFEQIIRSIKDQNKANSKEAANYVAFLGFAGCRHGQAKAFEWKQDWIVFPSGVTGSKKAATRRLPISPRLRVLLDSMRSPESTGPLFKIKSPREALKNACDRLRLPHLRIHDLRHFFGSYAIEAGVEVPTVAKWLGHKDGGKLLLKTYSHIRDQHSLDSAAKLK